MNLFTPRLVALTLKTHHHHAQNDDETSDTTNVLLLLLLLLSPARSRPFAPACPRVFFLVQHLMNVHSDRNGDHAQREFIPRDGGHLAPPQGQPVGTRGRDFQPEWFFPTPDPQVRVGGPPRPARVFFSFFFFFKKEIMISSSSCFIPSTTSRLSVCLS